MLYVIFYLCVALCTHLLIDIFISNFFQMDFREALLEVYHGKMFPSCSLEIELELEKNTRSRLSMKDKVWLSLSVLLSIFLHLWWMFFHWSSHIEISYNFVSVFQYNACVARIDDLVSMISLSNWILQFILMEHLYA